MILYTYLPERESALGPLLDLLLNDPAVLQHSFDLPVPGAKLAQLGVLARAVIGTGLNQPTRLWGSGRQIQIAESVPNHARFQVSSS
jgi:hypothetical protein